MVVMLNTLHHIPNPKQFLSDVKNLLVPGGVLILAEIYSWHEMLDLPKVCKCHCIVGNGINLTGSMGCWIH